MIDYTLLTPMVKKAARAAHSSFPAHEVDDTEQTIWVWVFENKKMVEQVNHGERSEGALYNLMLKAANEHLKTEDSAVYGYHPEDIFYYSTDLIEKILEVVFQYEDWQSFASALDAMPRGKSDPATAGNNLASYADVKSAVERLPEDQYNVIVWRYKYSYTFENIGEEVGITRQGAQSRHDVAVRAVQRDLGQRDLAQLRSGFSGRTDPSGTAQALSVTDHQYNG